MAGCRTPASDDGAPASGVSLQLIRRSQPLLGTFVTITAYGEDRELLNTAVSAAFAEFQRVDALMSVHRPESELSRLNAELNSRSSFSTFQCFISPSLAVVLAQAQEISATTDGAFDVTIKPLADLWGFIRKEGYRLPEEAELRAVFPRVNWRHLEVDAAKHILRIHTNGVALDLGGIAKGYAVDCAVDQLRSRGITNALVKAGGDLRVMGAPPGQAAWTVQLEDPRKQGLRGTIQIRDAALSTSGNYENYFEIRGHRYAHILNPRTGLPIENIAACTVIAPTCMESDAWATALSVVGPERSLERFGATFAFRFTRMPTANNPSVWPIVSSPAWLRRVGTR